MAVAAPADALARGAKETAEGEAPREGGGTAAAIRRAAGESVFPVMTAWATGAVRGERWRILGASGGRGRNDSG